jgi:TPP-dependent pyruvate/acetoin dehydrogenase alpha subunit
MTRESATCRDRLSPAIIAAEAERAETHPLGSPKNRYRTRKGIKVASIERGKLERYQCWHAIFTKDMEL